jgi:hypothetical protein
VDGAIMILHLSGHLRATQNSVAVAAKQLDQSKIGPTDFRTESVFIGTHQLIALRTLFQQAGVQCQPGEESAKAGEFVRVVSELAARAGGDAPAPTRPSTPRLTEIRGMSGNDQLQALYADRDSLQKEIKAWKLADRRITERTPRWRRLQELLRHARGLDVVTEIAPQVEAIAAQRLLLHDPDPIPALCDRLTNSLRSAVIDAVKEYRRVYEAQVRALEESSAWKQIAEDDRTRILAELDLAAPGTVSVGTEDEVVQALERTSLDRWGERRDALQSRFGRALETAVRLLTPKARKVTLPTTTISKEEDINPWLDIVREHLTKELAAGPLII